jgi:glycosyltransferase involved in cell wall biosynthesis
VQDIISIFPNLKARYSNVKLLIVGGGEILTKLQQQVNDIGANHDIIFTGSVPHAEVFNYINLMDIAVMPNSNWYGSPVKIFEYAYMKKAVVALNNGPMNDVMEHEKDGLLIEANLDSLESALITLVGDESLRAAYAQHFHDKVVEHHTWFKMGEKILKDFPHRSE